MCGSNCCTPGASSRWRRCRSPWRSTSKAISGRSSSSRTPTCMSCIGLDVQELAIWRPLVDACRRTGRAGPAGAGGAGFLLPARHGGHRLSARARQIDRGGRSTSTCRTAARLLPQPGILPLVGRRFRQRVPPGRDANPAMLPPYVEFVKRRPEAAPARPRLWTTPPLSFCGGICNRCREAIRSSSSSTRFAADLHWLADAPLEVFHQYSFATLRQFGACYELAATYLHWLQSARRRRFRAGRLRRSPRFRPAPRPCSFNWPGPWLARSL